VSFSAGMFFLLFLHSCAGLWAFLFTLYLQKRIGGITGDTIGTTIELSEIITFFFFLTALKYLS
jgi:cobalamin synthase